MLLIKCMKMLVFQEDLILTCMYAFMSRLWLVTGHVGVFVCLSFGQVGFKGRSEE